MKWHSLTPQQEEKSAAIVFIGGGLFMLLKVPMLYIVWAIPGAEDAPSFEKLGMESMIAGGVMLIVGAALAWHAWARNSGYPR